MPRVVGKQQHRCNAPANTPSEYWKRNLYLPFTDHLISELTDRLILNEPRFIAQYLIPSALRDITHEKTINVYVTFRDSIPAADNQEFKGEVQIKMESQLS